MGTMVRERKLKDRHAMDPRTPDENRANDPPVESWNGRIEAPELRDVPGWSSIIGADEPREKWRRRIYTILRFVTSAGLSLLSPPAQAGTSATRRPTR